MSGTISFQPFSTSTPQNTFLGTSTQGYVQGCTMDDPVAWPRMVGGVLASTETVVMWGGRPIEEFTNITAANASEGLGPVAASATSQATCTGWTVWAPSMVLVPGGAYPPVASIGNFVGFYRYGSGARIVVACDPALITTLAGSPQSVVGSALYWDVTNYRITLTTSGGNWALPTATKLTATNSSNSKIVTYASSQASWVAGSAAVIQLG